nr:probable ATP-dependent RNA helicase DDX28 [Pogona vitticeps]
MAGRAAWSAWFSLRLPLRPAVRWSSGLPPGQEEAASAKAKAKAEEIPVAGWKHRQSRGDYFQLLRTCKAPPREEAPGDEPAASFLDLGVEAQLCSVLQEELGITRPSPVQKRVIPPLLAGANALCAGETGSGKTLAYLLPLIQRLLRFRSLPSGLSSSVVSPHSLVVLPSRELAGQVKSVAARLCAPLGLRVREIGGGRGLHSVRQKIRAGPTDLLVSTPGILNHALKKRVLTLEKVHCLVLDEVDTLLDPSFVDLVESVLQHAPLVASDKEVVDVWDPKTQLVAVGATVPKGLQEMLSKVADIRSIRVLSSSNLHRLQPHVEQKFIRVKGSEKVTELVQLIKDRKPSSGAVLVFCKDTSTVNWLSYILDDHKIKHQRLQGHMEAATRASIFRAFQKGTFDVLVCTDIASRGLDTIHVEFVINYDFPQTLQDYLHRVGRVGRIGSKFPGTVISFVTHRWDVDLVWKIETAARKRTPLPGMEPILRVPV